MSTTSKVGTGVKHLMEVAICGKSSTVMCVAGNRPMLHVRGTLRPIDHSRLEHDHIVGMVREATGLPLVAVRPEGLRFGVRPMQIKSSYYHARGCLLPAQEGLSLSLKVMPTIPPTLRSLGCGSAVNRLLELPSGLVIVSGPADSGKTTTLASMVVYLASLGRAVCTVERPIDIGVAPRAFNKAAINQVEVPQEQNLRRVVRSVLRNNPDVLVIGEIPGRDHKLWQLAVDAAASGTLVLVSVRRSGAVAALEQCVESFRAADRASIRGQLAATVLAVVGQKLLPSQDGDGRVLVDELILPAKAGIREMISRGEFEMIRCVVQEHKEGLRSIDAGLIALAEDGRISRADALEVAHHAHIVKARLQRVASSK